MEALASRTLSRKPNLGGLNQASQAIPQDWDGRKPLQGAYSIELRRVEPDPDQPRKDFDPQKLEELKLSIQEIGIIQPITVRYVPEAKAFRIISGERRYRAATAAGFVEIPCWVQNTDDQTILVRQVVENWQRADLDPLEVSNALARLQKEHKCSQTDLARLTGKPQSEISRLLSIQNAAPEVLAVTRAAEPGKYTRRHYVAIAGLKPEDQQEIVAAVERQNLNAIETEELARRIKAQRLGQTQRGGRGAVFRYQTEDATVEIRFRRSSATSADIQQVLDHVEAQLFAVDSNTAKGDEAAATSQS